MPASAAARATAASSAAAPARMRVPSTSTLPKAAGRRTPRRECRRRAPEDWSRRRSRVTRMSAGLRGEEGRQIVGIGGTEQNFRRTAGAEPDQILQRRAVGVACRARAEARRRDGSSSRLALQLFMAACKPCTQAVIEPAPRQTMAPPGLA